MRKFRGIVQTIKEPEDENILWYKGNELLFFNNGEWQPLIDCISVNELNSFLEGFVSEDTLRNALGEMASKRDLSIAIEPLIKRTDVLLALQNYVDYGTYNNDIQGINGTLGGLITSVAKLPASITSSCNQALNSAKEYTDLSLSGYYSKTDIINLLLSYVRSADTNVFYTIDDSLELVSIDGTRVQAKEGFNKIPDGVQIKLDIKSEYFSNNFIKCNIVEYDTRSINSDYLNPSISAIYESPVISTDLKPGVPNPSYKIQIKLTYMTENPEESYFTFYKIDQSEE